MRISDWSSDVCSSDLAAVGGKGDSEAEDHHNTGEADEDSCHEGCLPALDNRTTRGPRLRGGQPYTASKGTLGCIDMRARPPAARSTASVIPAKAGTHQIGRASCWERVCQDV